MAHDTAQVTDLEKQVEALEAEVEVKQVELRKSEAEVCRLSAENAGLHERYKQAQNDIDALSAKVDSMDGTSNNRSVQQYLSSRIGPAGLVQQDWSRRGVCNGNQRLCPPGHSGVGVAAR
jgi:septal ring factor EnvC (AmiA/AmiB activator)